MNREVVVMGAESSHSESEQPRIFLADDEAEVREAIVFMLQVEGLDCQAYAAPGELLANLGPEHRGCVLLDVRMPGMNGLELQRLLQDKGVSMPVIFISGHADVGIAVRAVQAGALDFLEKPFNNECLLEKIRNALELDAGRWQSDCRKTDIEKRLATLTPREREVMEGLLEGKLNKLIADDLSISVRTVEIHRSNVLRKLEARNSSELVRLVLSTDAYRDWLL